MKRGGVALIALTGVIALIRMRARQAAPAPAVPNVVAPIAIERPVATPVLGLAKTPPTLTKDLVFERGADLARFASLAAKVLASDDERAECQRLVHDADLLIEAGKRLTVRRLSSKSEALEQDRALALLLEAARAHEPTASAALAAVVRDGAIEDVKLDPSVRTQIAGLKAEAMFTWSADAPEASAAMASLLPGPVSRKIWDNVQSRQRANRLESAAGRVARGEDD